MAWLNLALMSPFSLPPLSQMHNEMTCYLGGHSGYNSSSASDVDEIVSDIEELSPSPPAIKSEYSPPPPPLPPKPLDRPIEVKTELNTGCSSPVTRPLHHFPYAGPPPPQQPPSYISAEQITALALTMRAPPPRLLCDVDSDRFYKFGTPSPPSVPENSPSCFSELEESGFHSDEEMQKVRG